MQSLKFRQIRATASRSHHPRPGTIRECGQQEEEARRAAQQLRNKEVERERKEIESIRVEQAKKLAHNLKEKGTLKADIKVCGFSKRILPWYPKHSR